MTYRILTENKNKTQIAEIVSRRFEGFTLLDGQGYWKGNSEGSLVVEIDCDKKKEKDIRFIAQRIKLANKQEAVLVQKIKSESVII